MIFALKPCRRNRRHSAAVWIAVVLAIATSACTSPSTATLGPVNNVILVSIDSLRADHLGSYGYTANTSPTIDRLASKGVLFERAYSTTSWTLPAHAALLTGLDNQAHGVIDDGIGMAPGIETLAQAAQNAGLATTGFFSGPYLHPVFGFGRGFDSYINCTSYAATKQVALKKPLPHHMSHADVTNPILLTAVDKWLSTRSPAKRNFIFLHMWDVHYDFVAPQHYVDMFDSEYAGTLNGRDFQNNKAIKPGMNPRDLQHLLALYDAEIRYTDETLGTILDRLEDAGLLNNSAVFIVADHGDEFLEHGRKGHRLTLFEEVLHVPMILNVSGQSLGHKRVGKVVSLVDVFPTVCDLLDIQCPVGSGQSLLPLLVDSRPSRGTALAELTTAQFGIRQQAFVDNEGKIIRWLNASKARYFTTAQLDEKSDGEWLPIDKPQRWSRAARDTSKRMDGRLLEALRLNAKIIRAGEASAPAVDDETRDHLRSLGYIE